MRLPKVVMVVAVLAATSIAADTPEQAIMDTVLAKDAKTVLKHLPTVVAESLRDLPPKVRAAALEQLLPQNWFGAKASRADDGMNLLRAENPHSKEVVLLRVTKQVNSGLEAVLEVEACQETCYGGLQVWMRLEDREWRFTDVRDRGRTMASFADPAFLQGFLDKAKGGSESNAVARLRTINTALVTYLSTYEVFPEKLANLAGDDIEDLSADHAMLLDVIFMEDPCIIGGYLFTYRRINDEEYEITAMPVGEWDLPRRNFYTDQSGVIRATSDNRPATKDDPAI